MADKRKQSQQTSLLLSPPGNGFSFGESNANALLLPVAQSEEPFHHTEGDSFIGQTVDPSNDPPPFTLFQQPSTTTASYFSDPFAGLGDSSSSDLNADKSLPSLNVSSNLPSVNIESKFPSHVPTQQPSIPSPISRPQFPYVSAESSVDHPAFSPTHLSPSGTSKEPPHIPEARRASGNVLHPIQYQPIQPHWFFCKEIEKKEVWLPFSLLDSVHLEEKYNAGSHDEDVVVPTDGGRYDVHLFQRRRTSVYWEEEPSTVRRCTWFYRGEGEKRYVPYEEHFAVKLEEEYRIAVTSNTWHRRLEFPGGETIIIHNPNVVVHFQSSHTPDEWGNISEGQLRPRVVKRGIEEFDNIEDGEAIQIDHLVFVVHGIGGFCDLKFRTVTEVVDDFRAIGNNLLRTHFRKHVEDGTIGRVEFLPISWHKTLHGDATGIDNQLHPITLNSIPKLRYFANDTILDVLFYTSPVYCQTIVNQVGSELNRVYHQFLERNPTFNGNVSLIGHSLGSVILFDLLLRQTKVSSGSEDELEHELSPIMSDEEDESTKENQPPEKKTLADVLQELNLDEYLDLFEKEKIDIDSLMLCQENDLKELGLPLGPRKKLLSHLKEQKNEENSKKVEKISTSFHSREKFSKRPQLVRRHSLSTVNYMVGCAGTGQPLVSYPSLEFNPSCFFALGSPIAMFLTVRGLTTIRNDFHLPTCPAYFNIFHPFDPVAYRMEPLVDPTFTLKPVLIPHHKGRKRMHLEIKESLARVGNDLKQMLLDSLKSTWNSINEFARAHRTTPAEVEAEMEKLSSEHLKGEEDNDSDSDSAVSNSNSVEIPEECVQIGKLNGGRRFDYVLQEKPIESFNEYLFALQSHTCYWESEDTVLLVLKEVYSTMGIHPSLVISPRQVGPFTTTSPMDFQTSLTNAPDKYNNPSFQDDPQDDPSKSTLYTPTKGQTEPNLPQSNIPGFGMDPTMPIRDSPSVGPPPLTGFVRQPTNKK